MSDRTRTRLLALINANDAEARGGAVPTGIDAIDTARLLPAADVLLLVADGDPDAMIFRYTAFGELGGDSWHLSVADAKEQAGEEYGEALMEWEAVPEEVTDAHAYVITFASDRLNDRGKW
jgi:hypothetical protein